MGRERIGFELKAHPECQSLRVPSLCHCCQYVIEQKLQLKLEERSYSELLRTVNVKLSELQIPTALYSKCIGLLTFVTLYWPITALAQEPAPWGHALHLGGFYSSGDYGEGETTEIVYLPLSYEASREDWTFQFTVPTLRVSGLGNALVNIGGVTRAVGSAEHTSETGLGDLVASAIYHLPANNDSGPFIDLRFDVKLPTADEARGLGTGKTDYSLQIDLAQGLGDNLVFATAGYTFRGNTRLYPELQNSAFAQLGFARNLNEVLSAGFYYDFREAVSSFTAESHELIPYFYWRLSERWEFTGLAVWGFTDASADYSVLGQFSYRW